MTDRIRYALRIAAVVQQVAMPSFAVTAPAAGDDAGGAGIKNPRGGGRRAHYVQSHFAIYTIL